MIILGLIIGIIGWLVRIQWLLTIGVVLILIGLILLVAGNGVY